MREIPLTQFERDLYGIEHLWVEDELRHHTTPGKDGCEQMTDHISTEEAERIAKRLERMSPWLGIEVARKQLYEASDALRSLAAERDELRVALGEALDTSAGCPIEPPCGNCKFCRAFNVYTAGSQP